MNMPGNPHTAASRQRMSVSAKRRCTPEWRAALSARKRAKIDTAKLRSLYEGGMTQDECASALGVGRGAVFRALKRNGIRCRNTGKRDQFGDKNSSWRGAAAAMTSKHSRLHRAFGMPKKCDACGTADRSKWYDWANLTGDYDSPTDFMRMCRSCHRRYDNARRRGEDATHILRPSVGAP